MLKLYTVGHFKLESVGQHEPESVGYHQSDLVGHFGLYICGPSRTKNGNTRTYKIK